MGLWDYSCLVHVLSSCVGCSSPTMDGRVESSGGSNKKTTACDVEALKKCLEDNKGDYVKCQSHIKVFKSTCSLKKPNPSLESSSTTKAWWLGFGICSSSHLFSHFDCIGNSYLLSSCVWFWICNFPISWDFVLQKHSILCSNKVEECLFSITDYLISQYVWCGK